MDSERKLYAAWVRNCELYGSETALDLLIDALAESGLQDYDIIQTAADFIANHAMATFGAASTSVH